MWAKLFGLVKKFAPLAIQVYLETKAKKAQESK